MQPSLPLQVEIDQTSLSEDVAQRRSTQIVWTGLGFAAVLMLVGVSACALSPHATIASAKPSHLVPEVAFNPSLSGLGPGGFRGGYAQPAGLRPASALPVLRRPSAMRATPPSMMEEKAEAKGFGKQEAPKKAKPKQDHGEKEAENIASKSNMNTAAAFQKGGPPSSVLQGAPPGGQAAKKGSPKGAR